MGLNLQRERFQDWLAEYGPDGRTALLERLEHHIGRKIDVDAWQVEDDAYPKVGSYTTYGIFRLCLVFVLEGDYQNQLEDGDNVETEALEGFRGELEPASLEIPYAAHFLKTGDSDTIFIPVLFDSPFAYDDRYVASLPGAVVALEAFARGLQFDLTAGSEPEFDSRQWLPVSTAKNVARTLYGFFVEKENACVMFA